MDIFNRKRVAELEQKLLETERDRDKYKTKATEFARKLDELSKLEEVIPEGCEKGPWCKACEFCKTIHYTEYYGSFGGTVTAIAYACSKGKSCKNFVQKEITDE